jgi:hypothetical protein
MRALPARPRPRDCSACGLLQTPDHVLNVCTRYRRRRLNFAAFLRDSSDPGRDLVQFLRQPIGFLL